MSLHMNLVFSCAPKLFGVNQFSKFVLEKHTLLWWLSSGGSNSTYIIWIL